MDMGTVLLYCVLLVWVILTDVSAQSTDRTLFKNCEQLHENFSVSWNIENDRVIYQFTAILDGGDAYMSFGVSGSLNSSTMLGADVIIVYFDAVSPFPRVMDYTITARSLCVLGLPFPTGVCFDDFLGGSNDVIYESSSLVDGVTSVIFSRPLNTGDKVNDKVISSTEPVYVVWAMGRMVNRLPTKHSLGLKDDLSIHYGRPPSWNCSIPEQPLIHTTTLPPQKSPTPSVSGATSTDAAENSKRDITTTAGARQTHSSYDLMTVASFIWVTSFAHIFTEHID